MGLYIEWWRLILAAVGNMVVGFLWYSQWLFGPAWIRATGKTMDEVKSAAAKNMMWTTYLPALIASLVTAHLLSWVMALADVQSFGEVVPVAIRLWLGFMVAVLFADYLFDHHSRARLWITAGYHLVAMIVMGFIIYTGF